ncbi:EamA family transporter [Anaerobacillus arseniciselenatis]|uniref:EamA family transporter n=1 Tax=Anaerobacillus arseniciselenatis TaxID=85682 RepID=A0A1S2LJI3_9BACI|nr:DMT family transporter [Anaerobacillus arseniciselenatis]OIJ12273.1 EamA family transporter [Anaerobacillus arseniciselenatis]
MNKPIINPHIALAIGVISVSTSAIFVKLADAPAGVIAFYRLFFSFLIIAPLFFLKYRRSLAEVTKRDWMFSAVAGILLAFHFILWFESLNYTSVASSVVLVTLQPLFAFVGTYFFFKEKVGVIGIISGVLAIVGSIIISWGDYQISGWALFGNMLALLACAFVTGYLLFGQDVRKRIDVIPYTFIVYGISSITLLIYVLLLGNPLVGYQTSDWMYFILLALIPTLLGHSLFNWVIKWVSTNMISMSILFEPAGAIILAYFILNERLTWTQVVGGIVVIIGVAIFLKTESKPKVARSEAA